MNKARRRTPNDVRRAFYGARDDLRRNDKIIDCEDRPEEFVDYPVNRRPSEEEAAEMCGRGTDTACPLLQLCDEYARVTKPTVGVWGGRVWHASKRDNSKGSPMSARAGRKVSGD